MAEDTNYTPIQHYRSSTAGAVPSSADVAEGELAINLNDRIIYTKFGADIVPIGFGVSSTDWTVGGDTDFLTWLSDYVDNKVLQANRPEVEEIAGTSYTVAADDETKLLYFTSSSAVSVTVPDDNTVIPVGYIVHLHQGGTGQITVAGAGGVTVTSSVSLSTADQGAALSLFKTGANRWTLVGDQT